MTKNDLWIVVPNWDKFQHYKNRDPAWIKLYLDLRGRDAWRELSLSARGLLVSLWIEYAASQGALRVSSLPSRVAQKNLRRTLDSLQAAGFIEVSASPHALARDREEKEKETPYPLPEKGEFDNTQNPRPADRLLEDLVPPDPDRVAKIRELAARIGRDM
jgi:hypothetical protein